MRDPTKADLMVLSELVHLQRSENKLGLASILQRIHDSHIAMQARIAELEVRQVQVPALEWCEARVFSLKYERFTANSIFGVYEVLEWISKDYGARFPSGGEFSFATPDAAKAAAQADFEQRVISCLSNPGSKP